MIEAGGSYDFAQLDEPLRRSAAAHPEAVAIFEGEPERTWTYGELDRLADQWRLVLMESGLVPGDRVGVFVSKSASAVVAAQAVLRAGCVCVPLDADGPPARAARMLEDCAARGTILVSSDAGRAGEFFQATNPGGAGIFVIRGRELTVQRPPADSLRDDWRMTDAAYILYTSGSTGAPKGVVLTHANVLFFLDRMLAEFRIRPDDVLANHAPLHFDLSLFDLYASFAVGAAVLLIPTTAAFAPDRLRELLVRVRVSVWYSVPAALRLLMQGSNFLNARDLPLRLILFAGEVFPMADLRLLFDAWHTRAALYNLYGPTETNVCTLHRLTPGDFERDLPSVPIGRALAGLDVRLGDVNEARTQPGNSECGADVGGRGEVLVSGPGVSPGYWRELAQGTPRRRVYATGDCARRLETGELVFVERLDRMIKLNGRRIEPAEIESALREHPGIREAAVFVGGEARPRLAAALVSSQADNGDRDETESSLRPGLLELKAHLAERLPAAMTVDRAYWLDALPMNRNSKLDLNFLKKLDRE